MTLNTELYNIITDDYAPYLVIIFLIYGIKTCLTNLNWNNYQIKLYCLYFIINLSYVYMITYKRIKIVTDSMYDYGINLVSLVINKHIDLTSSENNLIYVHETMMPTGQHLIRTGVDGINLTRGIFTNSDFDITSIIPNNIMPTRFEPVINEIGGVINYINQGITYIELPSVYREMTNAINYVINPSLMFSRSVQHSKFIIKYDYYIDVFNNGEIIKEKMTIGLSFITLLSIMYMIHIYRRR